MKLYRRDLRVMLLENMKYVHNINETVQKRPQSYAARKHGRWPVKLLFQFVLSVLATNFCEKISFQLESLEVFGTFFAGYLGTVMGAVNVKKPHKKFLLPPHHPKKTELPQTQKQATRQQVTLSSKWAVCFSFLGFQFFCKPTL